MADSDFQTEYFEPIFLNIVLLNLKIKQKKSFTQDEKAFYDILRYAFPIIKRISDNQNLTLGESINDPIKDKQKDNVKNEQQSYQQYSFNRVDYSSEEYDTD